MPAWIHDRARKILEDTRKQYGKEKGKEVAFAVATQQAHATGQSPKKWHGKPFGTSQGKREAKEKYDSPAKMKKSACDRGISLGRYTKPTELINKWLSIKSGSVPTGKDTPPRIIAQDRKANAEQGLAPDSSGMSITSSIRSKTRSWEDAFDFSLGKTASKVDTFQPKFPLGVRAVSPFRKVAQQSMEGAVSSFLRDNQNPTDEEFHRWAESQGRKTDSAEEAAYALASRHSAFLGGGKSNEEGKKPSDFSSEQISKGLEVEKEHTPVKEDKLKITTDHLTEDPRYYNNPMFAAELGQKGTEQKSAAMREKQVRSRLHGGWGLPQAAQVAGTLPVGGIFGAYAASPMGQARAFLGRLRKGEHALTDSERALLKKHPELKRLAEQGGGEKTYPISRFFTHPVTGAVGGGLAGSAISNLLGAEPGSPGHVLGAIGGALGGGGLTWLARHQHAKRLMEQQSKEGAFASVLPHFMASLEKLGVLSVGGNEKEGQAETTQSYPPEVDSSFLQWLLRESAKNAPTGQQLLEQAAETGSAVGENRLRGQLAQFGM